MALTASATKIVQDDIIVSLDMRLDRLYRVVHCKSRDLLRCLMDAERFSPLAFNRVVCTDNVQYSHITYTDFGVYRISSTKFGMYKMASRKSMISFASLPIYIAAKQSETVTSVRKKPESYLVSSIAGLRALVMTWPRH